MGLKVWFANCGVASVVEMDWWQEETHPSGLRIGFTPAQVCSAVRTVLRPGLSRGSVVDAGSTEVGQNFGGLGA